MSPKGRDSEAGSGMGGLSPVAGPFRAGVLRERESTVTRGSTTHADRFGRTRTTLLPLVFGLPSAIRAGDIPWPVLDDVSIARLRAIPVWSMALETEISAGSMLKDMR